jgi:ABC-type sulfate/molybdate transport systems ATPase subunit
MIQADKVIQIRLTALQLALQIASVLVTHNQESPDIIQLAQRFTDFVIPEDARTAKMDARTAKMVVPVGARVLGDVASKLKEQGS